ncbi:hypothetical protein H6501_00115 [Candidatus Woesearchaeota archaeon]|nr:hypothetical protein [Nanoarchaeota archaeon]MCB9369986.1 hypothetical protein [Candidatus Woesearchaeota archaeon]USN44521.1 MAG: hypothetical protein H6500_01585 [Candidatus Woesearchaeota archaeon]
MSEWKTLKEQTIEAGGNNFIEINVKQPPEGETKLIGISKGWYTDDGQKRYKANILFSREKRDELVKVLQEIDTNL